MQKNPKIMVAASAIGIVAIIVLAWYVRKYKPAYDKCGSSSGFLTQYPYTGLHSNWQLGSMDAGYGGSLQRDTTPQQLAAYYPGWQPVGLERAVCGARENMSGPIPGPGAGAMAGTPHSSMSVPAGCGGCRGATVSCGAGWDPNATAEAVALATLGGLPSESGADSALQATANSAFDCSNGLSDSQLSELMHNGGAP